RMAAHGASSIQIKARAWVKSEDYWTVYFDLTESVKKEFDQNGIEIPYDQLDVHIKKD
ncbi:MAG: mechanosensitive ion channel, partial [Ruminococcaceae bacterium]|nr:mechanosensitive ion channel [Oscillospiraceae bacterium]